MMSALPLSSPTWRLEISRCERLWRIRHQNAGFFRSGFERLASFGQKKDVVRVLHGFKDSLPCGEMAFTCFDRPFHQQLLRSLFRRRHIERHTAGAAERYPHGLIELTTHRFNSHTGDRAQRAASPLGCSEEISVTTYLDFLRAKMKAASAGFGSEVRDRGRYAKAALVSLVDVRIYSDRLPRAYLRAAPTRYVSIYQRDVPTSFLRGPAELDTFQHNQRNWAENASIELGNLFPAYRTELCFLDEPRWRVCPCNHVGGVVSESLFRCRKRRVGDDDVAESETLQFSGKDRADYVGIDDLGVSQIPLEDAVYDNRFRLFGVAEIHVLKLGCHDLGAHKSRPADVDPAEEFHATDGITRDVPIDLKAVVNGRACAAVRARLPFTYCLTRYVETMKRFPSRDQVHKCSCLSRAARYRGDKPGPRLRYCLRFSMLTLFDAIVEIRHYLECGCKNYYESDRGSYGRECLRVLCMQDFAVKGREQIRWKKKENDQQTERTYDQHPGGGNGIQQCHVIVAPFKSRILADNSYFELPLVVDAR